MTASPAASAPLAAPARAQPISVLPPGGGPVAPRAAPPGAADSRPDEARANPPRGVLRQEVRAVRQALVEIPDEQVLKVLAVIDGLAQRGEADDLLQPLRARLGQLRPGRQLRLTRVLFAPFDRIIVDARTWKRDPMTIPRSALNALCAQVHAGIGPLAGQVEEMIAGRSTADAELLGRAGGLLWPAAATVLEGAAPGPHWAGTGLTAEDFALIAGAMAALLPLAAGFEEICAGHEAGEVCEDAVLADLLDRAAAKGLEASRGGASSGARFWGLMFALMLERLAGHPALQRLAGQAARGQGPGSREAIEHAVGAVLGRMEAGQAEAGGAAPKAAALGVTAAEIRRAASLLDGVGEMGLGAEHGRRAAAMRHHVDMACRDRFSASLSGDFLPSLDTVAVAPGHASDAELAAMEGGARGLRQFEMAARGLGGGSHYDGLLRDAAERVRTLKRDGALSRMDRARMLEILAGPEAGLEFLRRFG